MTEKESSSNVASGPELAKLIDEARQKLSDITAIAQQATIKAGEIAEAKNLMAVGLAEVQAHSSQVAALATDALAALTQITDHQTVIATKSDHIEQAQVHADKVRADLDRQLTAAKQQTTDAEAFKARAQSAADSASETLLEVKAARAAADADSKAITELESEASEATDLLKGLANKAASVEERIASYEAQLTSLRIQSEAQLAQIIGLLPGATSAGLAFSFDKRRESFLKPSERWQWFFVGSLGILIALALTGLWNVYTAAAPLTYDELFRLWLARLPIAAALIWLAIHSSREAALAKRLEEDYGYKAAVAASFQGFHNQMSDLADKATPDTPLAKLCTDTLTTIGSPPGRIYDKHNLTASPTTEVLQAMKDFLQSQGSAKTATPPKP